MGEAVWAEATGGVGAIAAYYICLQNPSFPMNTKAGCQAAHVNELRLVSKALGGVWEML